MYLPIIPHCQPDVVQRGIDCCCNCEIACNLNPRLQHCRPSCGMLCKQRSRRKLLCSDQICNCSICQIIGGRRSCCSRPWVVRGSSRGTVRAFACSVACKLDLMLAVSFNTLEHEGRAFPCTPPSAKTRQLGQSEIRNTANIYRHRRVADSTRNRRAENECRQSTTALLVAPRRDAPATAREMQSIKSQHLLGFL